MMQIFKRHVENIELVCDIPDVNARIEFEERFCNLRIIIEKKETEVK